MHILIICDPTYVQTFTTLAGQIEKPLNNIMIRRTGDGEDKVTS